MLFCFKLQSTNYNVLTYYINKFGEGKKCVKSVAGYNFTQNTLVVLFVERQKYTLKNLVQGPGVQKTF